MNGETLRWRDQRLAVEPIAEGVKRLRLSSLLSRAMHFDVTCYLVDDLLVDAGFTHCREVLVRYLDRRELRAICCTHHHEDHTGNAGVLAARHGCPVYLMRPERLETEGLRRLPPYRRLWWGAPATYGPVAPPERIASAGGALRVIPTPGHSATHVVFLEERRGLLFAGDLYITGGVTGVMRHENPDESIRSLRRAALDAPARLLNGHGLDLPQAAQRLREKADRLEAAAARVRQLHRAGIGERAILRRLFPRDRHKDWLMAAITGGEFSRQNFVRACLAHMPDLPDA